MGVTFRTRQEELGKLLDVQASATPLPVVDQGPGAQLQDLGGAGRQRLFPVVTPRGWDLGAKGCTLGGSWYLPS